MIRFAARLLGSALLSFSLAAHGEPKAVTEKKKEKRPAVLVCYQNVTGYCKTANEKLTGKSCQPPVDLIEMTDSPTVDDIKKKLKDKGLPDGTPVFVIGHGMEKYKGVKHHISTADGEIATADILDAFSGFGKPTYWLTSCMGGQACDDDKKGFCLGAVCQKNQDATLLDSEGGIDKATQAIMEIYCNETEFNLSDKNKDGVLDRNELTSYFCEKAKGGRPYVKFYARKKNYAANKKKIQEMVDLIVKKLVLEYRGDSLEQKDNDALKALMDENDEEKLKLEPEYERARRAYNTTVNPYNSAERRLKRAEAGSDEEKEAQIEFDAAKMKSDDAIETKNVVVRKMNKAETKFAIDKSSTSFHNDIVFYVRQLKGKIPVKGNTWTELPDQAAHVTSSSGEKLDQTLVLEFPAAEKRACIWVDGRTVSQFNPHLDNFSLRFRPIVPTEGGEKPSATAESHKSDEKPKEEKKEE